MTSTFLPSCFVQVVCVRVCECVFSCRSLCLTWCHYKALHFTIVPFNQLMLCYPTGHMTVTVCFWGIGFIYMCMWIFHCNFIMYAGLRFLKILCILSNFVHRIKKVKCKLIYDSIRFCLFVVETIIKDTFGWVLFLMWTFTNIWEHSSAHIGETELASN